MTVVAEIRSGDDTGEQVLDGRISADTTGDRAAWDARRRIERLRELRRLRELLDDPGFSDLD